MMKLLCIAVGASLGAWMRWGLGIALNPLFSTVSLGTLAANLVGGYIIGIMMPLIMSASFVSELAALAIITGFLGGLTTFSTFSAEAVHLLGTREYAWALGHILLHVAGTVIMTMLGIFTIKTVMS